MENTPYDSRSYEASDPDADKPGKDRKKKKSTAAAAMETSVDSDKKQKAQEDIVKSLNKMSLFERPDASKENDESAEALPVEQLTIEEVAHIQQETARAHLAAMEEMDEETAQELEPAAEFLRRVADGQEAGQAFHEVAAEAGLQQEQASAEVAQPTEAADRIVSPGVSNETNGTIDTSQAAEGVVQWRSAAPVSRPRQEADGSSVVARSAAGPAETAPAAVASANVLPPRANSHYEAQRKGGELLLIGLVGYLVGRRRGRIRAEKRLLPVQRKLEKQVKTIEADITSKEQQLVAAAAEKRQAEMRPPVALMERTQPGRTETRLGMEKPVRERLGHMIVAAEAPQKPALQELPASLKHIKVEKVPDMSRGELLEVSDKVIVEGASLRRIYESHLIGERQLRHLVQEHLRGHDIRKDLRREMVEHEIDFERDPMLRDRVRSQLAASEGGGLSDMLAKAGITTNQVDPAFEKRVQQEQARQEAQAQAQRRRRLVADSAMATAIVILAAIVAVLVFNR